MHVTMTTANCPERERERERASQPVSLYGVWLEHKAGPPKVILWPPSFNLPKQICRHQRSSLMFPYKSILDRPEFYFVTVLYSLSVDFRIVLRMHFTFCNFLLPSSLEIDARRREKRWLCTRRSSIVLQGEKSGLWSSSPRHSAMKIPHVLLFLLLQPKISKCNVEFEAVLTVSHRNSDLPWPHVSSLTAPVQRSPNRATLYCLARSRYVTMRCLHVDSWMSLVRSHVMQHGPDRSRKRVCMQWARMLLTLKRNFETSRGGGGGVHWQQWTPPLYAPGQSVQCKHFLILFCYPKVCFSPAVQPWTFAS